MTVKGMLVVVLVAASLVGCRTKAEKEAYEKKRQELIAENEAKREAEAAAQAVLTKMMRKACKDPDLELPSDSDVISTCRSAAESMAYDRDSVSFPFFSTKTVVHQGCALVYTSEMTVENAFGKELTHDFKCVYNPRTSTARVAMLR